VSYRGVSHLVVLLVGAFSCTAVVASEPASLCKELAAQVRQSEPAGAEKALSTGIAIAQSERMTSCPLRAFSSSVNRVHYGAPWSPRVGQRSRQDNRT
jgi:hypothetical protein